VELRWLEWAFEGRDVADPWGDRQDGRWHVDADETLGELIAALHAQAARTDVAVRDAREVRLGLCHPRRIARRAP